MMRFVDKEIDREYDKIKNDAKVFEVTSENQKNKFAQDILTTSMGDEIRHCNQYYGIKLKKKMSLTYRIKRFFNNIFKVFEQE